MAGGFTWGNIMGEYFYVMFSAFGFAGLVVYIIVMLIVLHDSLKINEKYHPAEGDAFLDFVFSSYTTYDKREATPKDVWKALLWPIGFLRIVGKCFLWGFNELLVIFLLALGFRYKNTAMYKKLENITEGL